MNPRTVVSTAIRYTQTAAYLALLTLTAVALPPAQAQTYTVLHTFSNWPDGTNPNAPIQDGKGNMYGTTLGGGIHCGSGGCGTVYKIDRNGKETVL